MFRDLGFTEKFRTNQLPRVGVYVTLLINQRTQEGAISNNLDPLDKPTRRI